MLYYIWQIFLILVFTLAVADALEPGDQVPDFVMPSTNGAPQRLSEQIGSPVMLVWLNDCNACEETLIDWQYLAESWEVEGLKTWFIWRKQAGYLAPWSRLPVLEYQVSNPSAWWFEPSPAVMFISPDGVLDYLFIDKVDERKAEVASELKLWLKNKKWFQLKG
ncbi:MAG: redoxin domain-containing protein [Oleispira sp.]|nr:redoxin domain-containing protein [Oleispira sp.]